MGCLVCNIGEKQQERKSFGFFGETYLWRKGEGRFLIIVFQARLVCKSQAKC